MEMVKVFQGIAKVVAIEVPEREKQLYLQSKFWHGSYEDARRFYYYYLSPVVNESPLRSFGVITGLIDDYNNPDDFFTAYEAHPEYMAFCDFINHTAEYRKNNLLCDTVKWAQDSQLIGEERSKSALAKIDNTRCPLSLPYDLRIKLIQAFIDSPYGFIEYGDARALLFPTYDLRQSLVAAIQSHEIEHGLLSRDMSACYFEITELIKWLMRGSYITKSIEDHFISLKVKSLQENVVFVTQRFSSIAKLVASGKDRNDLIQSSLNGENKLYLKYPRELLRWQVKEDQVDDVSAVDDCRRSGFGILKLKKDDDTVRGKFGGFTVDMLLFNERPHHIVSQRYNDVDLQIELVPTPAEACYGLQPYLLLPQERLDDVIDDSNLIMFVNETDSHEGDKKGVRMLRLERLNALLNGFIAEASEKGLQIDKKKFPGTKKELCKLIRSIDATFHTLSDSTLDGYFTDLGISFMRGAKTGKSDDFKELSKIVSDALMLDSVS